MYLYEQNDAEGLALAIEKVLSDKEYAKQLGQNGRATVFEKFDIKKTAQSMASVLEKGAEPL